MDDTGDITHRLKFRKRPVLTNGFPNGCLTRLNIFTERAKAASFCALQVKADCIVRLLCWGFSTNYSHIIIWWTVFSNISFYVKHLQLGTVPLAAPHLLAPSYLLAGIVEAEGVHCPASHLSSTLLPLRPALLCSCRGRPVSSWGVQWLGWVHSVRRFSSRRQPINKKQHFLISALLVRKMSFILHGLPHTLVFNFLSSREYYSFCLPPYPPSLSLYLDLLSFEKNALYFLRFSNLIYFLDGSIGGLHCQVSFWCIAKWFSYACIYSFLLQVITKLLNIVLCAIQ